MLDTTLLFQISPQSPLLIGNRSSSSNFQETADFIPGSVLRGALAEKLLQACMAANNLEHHDACPDPSTCPYWQVFGSDEPWFGNAYPGGTYGPIWPMPLTAHTCKRHPGWPSEEKPGHGILDTLLADFTYGLVSDPAYPQRALLQPELGEQWSSAWRPELRQVHDRCPTCGQSLKPARKKRPYYAWESAPQPAQPLTKQRAVHVGINRARGVAEDTLLYTQESIVPTHANQNFYAEMRVASANAAQVQAALTATFYIGRGRSRGYGKVIIRPVTPNPYPALADRLYDFNVAARAALLPYQAVDERVQSAFDGQLFSLTLRTPGIFDVDQRPLRVPDMAALRLPDGVLCLQSWARTEQVGGWHNADQLPRRTMLATSAGSVFLYFAPDTIPVSDLTAALARLEAAGIGRERERGYGRVTVCAAFHLIQAIEHDVFATGGSNDG